MFSLMVNQHPYGHTQYIYYLHNVGAGRENDNFIGWKLAMCYVLLRAQFKRIKSFVVWKNYGQPEGLIS